jgi:uncharacterized protein (DUF1800 family)
VRGRYPGAEVTVRNAARGYLIPAILVAFISPSGAIVAATPPVPNDDKAIAHALNRLAFGPRPGDVEAIQRIGLAAWIERQLRPSQVVDDETAARLARLETLELDPAAIAREYVLPARAERRKRQQQNATQAATSDMRPPEQSGPMPMTVRRARQVFTDLAEAKLLRATYSERQLEEVLVDFWFNHFNVFARKGQTELYIGEYERDVIRPHVFGKFRDLLGATAKSPAMLVYLDNWISGRQGALNENYGRELLELHTLGVDGGYTQQDVVAVARAFTGWTIGRPQNPGFRFAPAFHDRGEKRVLGQVIAAGGGVEDGERVLDILAAHPSTARHMAFKLAQRFVSDVPPPALVERAAARFRSTNGDLREVVRTLVTSPEFFAPESYGAKVKTPFEFVVSALRATAADVSSGMRLARALTEMGMPLYLCQPPTGYDETAEAWISSGSLVNRINFAIELASNRMRGVRVAARQNPIDIGSADFQKQ